MKKKIYLTEEKSMTRRVFELLAEISVCVLFGLFLAKYFFFSIETGSKAMEPTIKPDSIVFVNRTAYALKEPERFDTVAFLRHKDDALSSALVRRVIGLPGERIQIKKGIVYINGQELDVSQYLSEITSDGIAGNEIRLNAGEYFVLGDMPANSEDSRSTTVAVLTKDRIIGKSFLSMVSVTEFYLVK